MVKLREADSLPLAVERLKESIAHDSALRPTVGCKKCEALHFRSRGYVPRWFCPVYERQVYPILTRLRVWLCVRCGTSFRHLPAGCLPYKRYLQSEVESRCTCYVEEEEATYRSVVQDEQLPTVYAGPVAEITSSEAEKSAESHAYLSPSTVHGWITFLATHSGSLWRLEERAQHLTDAADLSHFHVARRKHCSEARRQLLILCRRLLFLLGLLAPLRNAPVLRTACRSP